MPCATPRIAFACAGINTLMKSVCLLCVISNGMEFAWWFSGGAYIDCLYFFSPFANGFVVYISRFHTNDW